MIRFDRFYGGKTHVVIMSFDDGRESDRKLVELLDHHNIKATFHLNSGMLGEDGVVSLAEVNELYRNHEVALHGKNHSRLLNCTSSEIVREVLADREYFESKLKRINVGFAYPFGDVTDEIYNAVRACGIEYARTTKSAHDFLIPEDFLRWNPTCHVNDALIDSGQFIGKLPKLGQLPLFFIWGHSHDFDSQEKWCAFEELLKQITGRDEIWYTTCCEFVSYMQAVHRLRVSVDETIIENPSYQTVWVSVDKQPQKIQGGQRLHL